MKTRRIGKIALTLATVLLLAFTAACVPAVTGEEKEAVTPTLTTQQGTIEIHRFLVLPMLAQEVLPRYA